MTISVDREKAFDKSQKPYLIQQQTNKQTKQL